jgi:hypothetical protein
MTRTVSGGRSSVMGRRPFIAGVAGVLAAPLVVEAQQAGKVYRVGILGEKAQTHGKLVCGRPSGSACGSSAGSRVGTF